MKEEVSAQETEMCVHHSGLSLAPALSSDFLFDSIHLSLHDPHSTTSLAPSSIAIIILHSRVCSSPPAEINAPSKKYSIQPALGHGALTHAWREPWWKAKCSSDCLRIEFHLRHPRRIKI